MVANINLIKQESYSIVNLEKQLMSNESPKQTLLNDFSHRLKMEGEEQLCDCVNELKLGLSSNNKYDLFKNKENLTVETQSTRKCSAGNDGNSI